MGFDSFFSAPYLFSASFATIHSKLLREPSARCHLNLVQPPESAQPTSSRQRMGRWQTDQNSIHIETINDLARRVVINVHMWSKAKQSSNGIWISPKYKLFVRRGRFTMFFPTKLNNLSLLSRLLERSWRFEWNQQCYTLHKHASRPPRHRRRKLHGCKPFAMSQGGLSLTKRERQRKSVQSSKVFSEG